MSTKDTISWFRDRVQQLETDAEAHRKTLDKVLQERLFSDKVLDSLPGIFYLYDEEGQLIRWNKNHELFTGFSGEDLRTRKLFDWISEENRNLVSSTIQKVFLHDERINIEAGLLVKDGSFVPYLFTGVRMTINRKRYLLGMGIDLSEQKKTEEALRKSEENYRAIFENAVDGIYQSTPDGKMVSCNPAMASLLGYISVEEFLASVKDVAEDMYFRPSDRAMFLVRIQQSGTISGHEVEFRHRDGHHIWVSINARQITDQNGKLQLIEGIATDITKKKHQDDLLRQQEAYLRKENVRLRSNIKDRYRFGEIIGKSRVMQHVYELILKAAATDANTIVYGESGTGKELVARAIHKLSDRKSQRFITVNCGAIPENLLESEFFGYRKGAFTGADKDKKGYLDIANGGTLFLDELGEIDQKLQVKLLRVLDGYSFTPVGGEESKITDVRIIAATNRDLQAQVLKGEMREDFFYRIHIIPIHVPPLRERKEDIPLLIDHFLRTNSDTGNDISPVIPGEMMEHILRHHWPGNVRELQNVLHRYRSLNQFDLLKEMSAPLQPKEKIPFEPIEAQGESYHATMADFEKKLLIRSLENHQWRRDEAARSMQLPLRTFCRKLKQHNLVRQKKCHK
jgi:PAS domain S-box-containing protein